MLTTLPLGAETAPTIVLSTGDDLSSIVPGAVASDFGYPMAADDGTFVLEVVLGSINGPTVIVNAAPDGKGGVDLLPISVAGRSPPGLDDWVVSLTLPILTRDPVTGKVAYFALLENRESAAMISAILVGDTRDTTIVLRQNDPIPDTGDTFFGIDAGTVFLNGHLVFIAIGSDRTSKYLLSWTDATLALLGRPGQATPEIFIHSFSSPVVNRDGVVYVFSRISSASSQFVIFRGGAMEEPEIIVAAGLPAPGTDGILSLITETSLTTNGNADCAFLATALEDGVEREGLFVHHADEVHKVALAGEQVEGLPDGVTFTDFGNVRLVDGYLTFLGEFEGAGVEPANDRAIFVSTVPPGFPSAALPGQGQAGVDEPYKVVYRESDEWEGSTVEVGAVFESLPSLGPGGLSHDALVLNRTDQPGGFTPGSQVRFDCEEECDIVIGAPVVTGGTTLLVNDVESRIDQVRFGGTAPFLAPDDGPRWGAGGDGKPTARGGGRVGGRAFWTQGENTFGESILISGDGDTEKTDFQLTVGANVESVEVEVTPADADGFTDGETPFQRTYESDTDVTVTAPAQVGEKCFLRWELDGEQLVHGRGDATVRMDRDRQLEAVYQCKLVESEDLFCSMIELLDRCTAEFPAIAVQVGFEGLALGPSGRQVVECLKALKKRGAITLSEAGVLLRSQLWVFAEEGGCDAVSGITISPDLFPRSDCHAAYALTTTLLFVAGSLNLLDAKTFANDPEKKRAGEGFVQNLGARRVVRRIMGGLDGILENRERGSPDLEGLDDCFVSLTNCKTEEIREMRKVLDSKTVRETFRLDQYAEVLGIEVPEEEQRRGHRGAPPAPAVFTPAEGFYATSFPSAERQAFPLLVTGALQSPVVEQYLFESEPPATGHLDTGIQRILDLAILKNASGGEVLLVLGTTGGYESGELDSGIIHAYDDTDGDGFFDTESRVILVAGDPELQSASSLTQNLETGDYHIYDAILRTLRRLEDTDGDAVPDTLVGESVIPDDPRVHVGMSDVRFRRDYVSARMRFGEVALGNAELAVFRDVDGDGFFETAERGSPVDIEPRAPAASTLPFFSKTRLQLAGSPGHVLRLDEVTAAGETVRTIGEATVPSGENTVTVEITAPLAPGQTLRIHDRTAELSSSLFHTQAPGPVVYGTDANGGAPSGGTRVVFSGEGLAEVVEVTFAGTAAALESASDVKVVVVAPPAPDARPGYVDVEFRLADGKEFFATSFVYQVPLPPTPLADAGAEQAVDLAGESVEVVLDGSASTPAAAERPITAYSWTGAFEGGISFGVSPTVRFTDAGEYWVVLVVSDGEGHSEPAATRIRVRGSGAPNQLPGDCNQDGALNLTDALCVLGYLFRGAPPMLPCGDGSREHAANLELSDWQGDGRLDLTDGVGPLVFLFRGGPSHPLAVPGAETSACVRIVDCPDRCR